MPDVTPSNPEDTQSIADALTSSTVPDGNPSSTKKVKRRCGVCKKKIGLTGFECRCGNLYCGIHRYSDKHDCTFDYKVRSV